MPDDLAPQFADSPDFFEAFGWTVADQRHARGRRPARLLRPREADAGGTRLVMTGDRDMFQCASERVTILYVRTGGRGRRGGRPGRGTQALRRGARARAGLHRAARRPLGRHPGRQGIGEKGAADLLNRHGSLEAALEGALRETKPRVRAALHVAARRAAALQGDRDAAGRRREAPGGPRARPGRRRGGGTRARHGQAGGAARAGGLRRPRSGTRGAGSGPGSTVPAWRDRRVPPEVSGATPRRPWRTYGRDGQPGAHSSRSGSVSHTTSRNSATLEICSPS